MHTNTKENMIEKCSKEGVENFPLKIKSMNNYIKYIELRICFVTLITAYLHSMISIYK